MQSRHHDRDFEPADKVIYLYPGTWQGEPLDLADEELGQPSLLLRLVSLALVIILLASITLGGLLYSLR
jgi:hypothetical protein